MFVWRYSTRPGSGCITGVRGAVSLISVSALPTAPMVGAYAQTCAGIKTGGDITRSLVVAAQDDVSDNTRAIAERWVQPRP